MRAEYNQNADPVLSAQTEEEIGLAYQQHLKNSLKRDPSLFYKYDAGAIAQSLRQFRKSFPDPNLVAKLYKNFTLNQCHAYMADELSKRILFFHAIDTDPAFKEAQQNWNKLSDPTRMQVLQKLHILQSEIYGFPPDDISGVTRSPRYPYGKETISHGSHDRFERKVFINTHQPKPYEKMHPSFRKGFADAATTVGHEGIHTKQNYFGANLHLISNAEIREVAEIMEMNTYGNYYLNDSFENYKLNPCEQEAFDFENDMKAFLDATPEKRQDLLRLMAYRRDLFYGQQASPQLQSLPAPAIAA